MWPFTQPSFNVLVVCTANICRSPAAESLLRYHLRKMGLHRRVRVTSAGVAVGSKGALPDPRVVSILAERGISCRGIRAKPVNDDLMRSSDFVWVMDRGHLEVLASSFESAPSQPELLALDEREIADPYFGDKAGVRAAVDQIEEAVMSRIGMIMDELEFMKANNS